MITRLRDCFPRHYIVLPLSLICVSMAACRATGQNKVDKRDVTFESGPLRMAGTLYRPRSGTLTPGIVLIHGSGQTDRSGLDHLAEFFSRNGVAVLAYDKRGVGKSQGDPLAWRDFNFLDLASDAAAAVAFLRGQRGIDTATVGLYAVSQGGWIAPLAAAQSNGVNFLIMQSASVTTVAEDNVFERSARLRVEGFSEEEVQEARQMHLVDLEVSRSGARYDDFVRLWKENTAKRWFKRVYLSDAPARPDHRYHQWYRTVMDFDPTVSLRRLNIPVLWLFGDPTLDRFGPVTRSVDALESLRREGKDYQITVFAGADHSLQLPRRGEAPYRDVILEWMKQKFARPHADVR